MAVSTEHWHIVDELLRNALDLDPHKRHAYLLKATGGDESLMGEVGDLLAASTEADTIFEREGGALTGPLWSDLARELTGDAAGQETMEAGQPVGPYGIIREVGRGGMAVVYEAERQFGLLRQRYAVKVVKRGSDTDEVVGNFSNERQILASLNHPNVARLYDGGMTEDGRPYFVMEFVDGKPITDYADEKKLTIEQRMQLVVDVCNAVHYAHQNLVIHRDIKPSNIMVTEDGVPKLVDFGIAKVFAEGDDDGEKATTRTSSRWMTPEYASPEQVCGSKVTTSSDVYGLGLVMYELLTGIRPFTMRHRDPLELRRIICEEMPERPSQAVTRNKTNKNGAISLQEIAQRRSVRLERFVKLLRGDIDTIVMKTLRKEPDRRYGSAEALAADINRYLSARPVKARRDTVDYRLRKFVKRNSTVVAALTIGILATVAFTLFHTNRITHQRNIAQAEADKSSQVASFMSGLLEDLGPNTAQGGVVEVSEILREGREKIDRELSGQSSVRAQLLELIGDIYEDYGEYDEAVRALDEAKQISSDTYGVTDPHTARISSLLGWTLLKRGDDNRDDAGRAQQLLEEALEQQTTALGQNHPDLATTLNYLGVLYHARATYDLAESYHREALRLRREAYGDSNSDVAESLANLGLLLQELRRYDEAEPLYQEALAINRELFTDHSELANSIHAYGGFLRTRGDYDRARSYYEEARLMRQRLYGNRHPQIAESLSSIGFNDIDLNNFDSAGQLLVDALQMRRDIFGPNHVTVANSLYQLSWLYFRAEQYDDAEPYLRQALDQYRALLGSRHPFVAAALNRLGLLLTELDDFKGAEAAYNEAIALNVALYSETADATTVARNNLALMYLEAGNFDMAEQTIRDVIAMREETLEEGHWRIAQAQRDLGAVLTAKGDYEGAEKLLVSGFTRLNAVRGTDDFYTQRAIKRLVELYTKWGRPAVASDYAAMLKN